MSSNNRSINTNFIFIAFVAAKTMGPRLGRWDIDGDPPMGSPANAVVGLFMLWWGWLAFNAGSTFGELHCCYNAQSWYTHLSIILFYLYLSNMNKFQELLTVNGSLLQNRHVQQ